MGVATVSNEMQSENPISDHFIEQLKPYISNKAVNIDIYWCDINSQMFQRLWFIGISDFNVPTKNNLLVYDQITVESNWQVFYTKLFASPTVWARGSYAAAILAETGSSKLVKQYFFAK